MSWEGYGIGNCEQGHVWTSFQGCYDSNPQETCPHCKSPKIAENIVDQTNGCDWLLNPNDTPTSCSCGRRELVEIEPPTYETCNLGHIHETKPGRYQFGEVHQITYLAPQ